MWTHHGQDRPRPCHQEMTFQWHGRNDSEIGPPEFNFHDGVESAGSVIQDGMVGGGPFNISHDVAARTIAQPDEEPPAWMVESRQKKPQRRIGLNNGNTWGAASSSLVRNREAEGSLCRGTTRTSRASHN